MNPFDFVNAINYTKKNIMIDDISEKSYAPYMVNRQLSYFPDTVLAANEMNKCHHIDHRLQFDFFINIIRKRKRFSKWFKPEHISDLDAVKIYYGYSNDKARQIITLLSTEQLNELKTKVAKGGRK
tara:strand:- start:790 stop:1167 length:378 start_codon:yes stop_codon:yes gene_type:complete